MISAVLPDGISASRTLFAWKEVSTLSGIALTRAGCAPWR